METGVNTENSLINSNIVQLGFLDRAYEGWTSTNEEHLVLLEGLKGIQRPGGFFSVGEFQTLDIALQLDANAIVLGDLDPTAVKKNFEVLRIVESSQDVTEVLPKIYSLIENMDGSDAVDVLKAKLTPEGAHTGSRIKLSFAQSKESFMKLKKMIHDGRVAVGQVDITQLDTMRKVGQFFNSHGTSLDSAYLSNVISCNEPSKKTKAQHQGTVRALFEAGGNENTLLIRSGSCTSPAVFEDYMKILPPNALEGSADFMAKKNLKERQLHYGVDAVTLPENIKRVYNNDIFYYLFEFFTQELGKYQQHTSSL